MILDDYINISPEERMIWLESYNPVVGLRYFGGKTRIGKYINNHLCNLAVKMKKDNCKADIFIDAFTGGGKVGLSIPIGWYDTIVINDLNYGVYSFYKMCEEEPEALIKMIEILGESMCEENFKLFARLRNFGKNAVAYTEIVDGEKIEVKTPKGCEVKPLVAAAMTYWVTSASYNGMTDPDKVTYSFGFSKDETHKIIKNSVLKDDESRKIFFKKSVEIEAIQKAIRLANKRIPELHDIIHKKNIVIENLDYRELIKKYNGKKYVTITGEEKEDKSLKEKNKLWYFDPPYHPYTLYGGEDAPYNDTFTVELANEMVNILAGGQEEEYGTIDYFVKSDYSIKEAVSKAKEAKANKFIGCKSKEKDRFIELLKLEEEEEISKIFDEIEKESPFKKVLLGGFDKGAVIKDEYGNAKKSVGNEYIWIREGKKQEKV